MPSSSMASQQALCPEFASSAPTIRASPGTGASETRRSSASTVLFVAEGRLVVERLIREGRYTVQSLLLSDAACRALEPVLPVLAPEVPIYLCDAEALRGITGYDVHRGCLALAVASGAAARSTPSCGTHGSSSCWTA